MKVVEIFQSIEGEGIRAGFPAIFIRLFGCNLHCSYCDTRYGCEGEDYTVMSVQDIVSYCKKTFNCSRVTVTGGEPLIHPGIELLLEKLAFAGYEVNVETNGTKLPIRINREGSRYFPGSIFYTMDYKCPSSGMSDQMDTQALSMLGPRDVLKFVVGNKEDLDKALEVYELLNTSAHVFLSPVFGQIEPKEIVDYLLKHEMDDCRVQVQLHKVIWSPDKRGV